MLCVSSVCAVCVHLAPTVKLTLYAAIAHVQQHLQQQQRWDNQAGLKAGGWARTPQLLLTLGSENYSIS